MADVAIKEKEILPPAPYISWFASLCFWLRSEQRKEEMKRGFSFSAFFSRVCCLAQEQPSFPVTFRLESAILGALQPRTLLSLGCENPSNCLCSFSSKAESECVCGDTNHKPRRSEQNEVERALGFLHHEFPAVAMGPLLSLPPAHVLFVSSGPNLELMWAQLLEATRDYPLLFSLASSNGPMPWGPWTTSSAGLHHHIRWAADSDGVSGPIFAAAISDGQPPLIRKKILE
ncbi:hypothetical protein Salat_0660900 [Sesamum alatum]|uniref:Uncharacterized protein n=1 Tax=Sesamum alatum TaxID=300844 RepID=A0AAE1YRL8_9LAMI|nr:hypothetical protein Salat_0660900 [Sesamum alatum]